MDGDGRGRKNMVWLLRIRPMKINITELKWLLRLYCHVRRGLDERMPL